MSNAMVVYRNKPIGNNSWVIWLVTQTMKKNKNNLVAVVGKTGSGKTLSAISICEMMSKLDGVPFTVEHIVFTLRALMDLINSGKLKRGSKIIFDEPQVSISAREFQSQANKIFNYLVSTFRHRNLTLFFCTPFETLLDKNTRKLFHARFQTMSINKDTQTCKLMPRYIEYADFKADPYRKQLIVFYKSADGTNKSKKLFDWDVHRPSKELEEEYEEKKVGFTDNLNRNITEKLKKFDESGKSMTAEELDEEEQVLLWKRNREPLTEVEEKAIRTYANIKGDKTVKKLEIAGKILGISGSAVSESRRRAMKKGYRDSEFKNPE